MIAPFAMENAPDEWLVCDGSTSKPSSRAMLSANPRWANLPIANVADCGNPFTPADAPALSRTGVAGVALVRAVMDSPDPAAAVREVLDGMGGRTRR